VTASKQATGVVALALLLIACGKAPPVSTAEEIDLALDLITGDGLLAHVAYLADDELEGRESGEPGFDAAAKYVAEQFESMGVEAGGIDGWYQQVSLRRYGLAESGTEMIIHRDGVSTELLYRDDYSMAADEVRETSTVRGEVVYAGFGVHAPEHGYSDYDGIDVKGKIIAVFRGAPEMIEGSARAHYSSSRTKSEEAVARGAIGSISLRSRKSEVSRPWAEIKGRFGKRPGMTWINDEGQAAGYYPELRGSASINIETGERLFGLSPLSFEEAHAAMLAGEVRSVPLGVEATLSSQAEHSTIKSPNVIGVVRGTDPELADEFIVYTAHLDHVGVSSNEEDDDRIRNGVYDNAIGVALMLETARAIAAAPARRSVMFIALTAEEKGLLGSDYFANNPTVPVESLVANINLDMPLFLYPIADLVAFGSQHSSLQSVTEESARLEGFAFSPDPLPEENLFVRSDQYSFVRAGVPAVYLIPGFASTDETIDGEALFRDHIKNHYHKPSDDMSRPIHWDSAVRFARAHTRIGYVVANEDQRPRWNEGDFFGDRFGRQRATIEGH
jgi:hypothetical protein